MNELSISQFKLSAIISIIAGAAIIALSLIIGKSELFLFLNADLGRTADWSFEYATYLGDGAIWVPIVLLILWKRRKYLVLILSSICISTLLAQLIKNYVFPAEPRPTNLIEDNSLIHTVSGVELHTIYSFPSGHTTTAFSIFLLAALFIPKPWIIPIGFMYGLVVGYSRVYLAQHFPLDVGAGMIVGTISVWLSMQLQTTYEKSLKEITS
jgi:membrane-associated phospholipid phosphatase